MRAVALHQHSLRGEGVRWAHVAHHQKASYVHAEIARHPDVLRGDIGFGAMCRHADRSDAQTGCALQVIGGADPRQQQRSEGRAAARLASRSDPFPVGMPAEAVVERRSGKPVAMRDLDRVHAGRIQRLRDL